MRSSLPLFAALLTSVTAIPVSTAVVKSGRFKLHVVDNADLPGWAVVNTKPKDRKALLLLERPAAFTSIDSYLLGTQAQIDNGKAQLRFLVNGRSYGMVAPEISAGEVAQVAILEGHGSQRFGLGSTGKLRVNGDNSADVFYACPQRVQGETDNPNFVLYYAPGGVGTEDSLPNANCKHIGLEARPVT